MAKKIFAAILILVILGLALALVNKKTTSPGQSSSQVVPAESSKSAGQPSRVTGKVKMTNMLFTPSQVTINKGETVTWTNNDKVAHTVTGDNGSGPASGQIQPGQGYSYTFSQSGSYQYHCINFSAMHGTIVVQ